jgi:hypothetical protein
MCFRPQRPTPVRLTFFLFSASMLSTSQAGSCNQSQAWGGLSRGQTLLTGVITYSDCCR